MLIHTVAGQTVSVSNTRTSIAHAFFRINIYTTRLEPQASRAFSGAEETQTPVLRHKPVTQTCSVVRRARAVQEGWHHHPKRTRCPYRRSSCVTGPGWRQRLHMWLCMLPARVHARPEGCARPRVDGFALCCRKHGRDYYRACTDLRRRATHRKSSGVARYDSPTRATTQPTTWGCRNIHAALLL